MRVIAGKMKGRRLARPGGNDVRPTADKVKEAIFSMISDYLEDAVVVDLFAGSGSLGIEALSRGAKFCYFCDNSADSIKLIKENIKICGAEGQSKAVFDDFKKALSKVGEKADIIFLDPPYEAGLLEPCVKAIQRLDVLGENGVIVCEHGAKDGLPDDTSGFSKIKEKKYGTVFVSLYKFFAC